MPGGVTITFLISEFIFMGTGILITAATLIWMKEQSVAPTPETVARLLLLKDKFPLQALLANGILIFAALASVLPSLMIPTSRTWLKVHAWFVIVCLIMTLVLGLNEWFQTLTTRANLLNMWGNLDDQTQSLLQVRFDCCGYVNYTTPAYVQDSVCTNDLVAASKDGCITDFSSYAERWLNLVFTAAFGVVGLDFILLLCIAMVIKKRKEQIRYRLIDEKRGISSI